MADLDALLTDLRDRFGVLAESNTYQFMVIADNSDVGVGDLFLMPCKRGGSASTFSARRSMRTS
jgi:hypothetical protein